MRMRLLFRFGAVQGDNRNRFCYLVESLFVVFADICWFHWELSLVKHSGGRGGIWEAAGVM